MSELKYKIANCSDVGASRQNNEDSMITFDCANGRVVAVCDGMGGENGGETASNLTVSIIEDILNNNTFDNPNTAITVAINAANQAVLRRAKMAPALAGMGSTCVMAIIRDGEVFYGSVGDSRIYYFDPEEGLSQITKDQSYVQTLVDQGEITAEDAENHPRKNEILNAIGLEGMTPAVIGASITPMKGSIFLLCSDGLTGMVPNMTIEYVLRREEWTLDQKVQKLVSLANEAGGLDNITVQLVEFDSPNEEEKCPAPAVNPSQINNSNLIKTDNKGKIIGLIVALLLIVGGVLAYFFLFNKGEEKIVVKDTPKVEIPKSQKKNDAKENNAPVAKENNASEAKERKSESVKETKKITVIKENVNKQKSKNISSPSEQISQEAKKKNTVNSGSDDPTNLINQVNRIGESKQESDEIFH